MSNPKPYKLSSLLKLYWTSSEKKYAFLLLIITLLLNLGFVYIAVMFNKWNNDFYNSIQTMNVKAFFHCLWIFIGLVALIISINAIHLYSEFLLKFRWRQWLTKHYTERWMKNNLYYPALVKAHLNVDNPDQRISQDIQEFVELSMSFALLAFTQVVMFFSFIVVLWNLSYPLKVTVFGHLIVIKGYLVWCALIYSAVGTFTTIKIGAPLVQLDYLQERYEANFRRALIRLQEKKEEIAIGGGGRLEKEALFELFEVIKINFMQILNRKFYISSFTNFYDNLSTVFPTFIAAVPMMFITKTVVLGQLMQIAGAFSQVHDALSIIIKYFKEIANWRAVALRLLQFENYIQETEAQMKASQIDVGPSNEHAVVIKNLSLTKPSGSVIFDNLNLKIAKGDRVLITGANGVGKSTLLRAMKELWLYGKGDIAIQADGRKLFIAQKPYMPIGSLLKAIYYPQEVRGDKSSKVEELLKEFELGYLVPALKEVKDWGSILSLGEQQKIAFIRALLYKPNLLVMDEPTASLDKKFKVLCVQKLIKALPKSTLIIVGHISTDGFGSFKKVELAKS